MATINILNALPEWIIQSALAQEALDNGNPICVRNGRALVGIENIDWGDDTPLFDSVLTDSRQGPVARLRDRSGEGNLITLTAASAQKSNLQAAYDSFVTFRNPAAANSYNTVGDPTADPTDVADVGDLLLVPITLDSGGTPGNGPYAMSIPGLRYPEIDSSDDVGTFRINAYDGDTFVNQDVVDSLIGGTLTWGANRYMGALDVTGMIVQSTAVLSFTAGQQYSVTMSDGNQLVTVPTWAGLQTGDPCMIINIAYLFAQISAALDAGSFQSNWDFSEDAWYPLEMFLMLGDAAGAKGNRIRRRIYPLTKPASQPKQSNSSDGAHSTTQFEFLKKLDVLGDGEMFFEQELIYP